MTVDISRSIYNKPEYLGYTFTFNFSIIYIIIVFIAAIYCIYIVTVMVRINNKSNISNKSIRIHSHLILPFQIMEIMNLIHFILESITLRLPSTALFTSILATIQPNAIFTYIFSLKIIASYSKLFYALHFCLIRLVIVIYPEEHAKICKNINSFLIPFSIVFPTVLCIQFFWIPSYCIQLSTPYIFGQVSLTLNNPDNKIFNAIRISLNFIIPCLIIAINCYIIKKIRKTKYQNPLRSRRSHKANISLTITTAAIIFPSFVDGIFTLILYTFRTNNNYLAVCRLWLGDICKLIVPLVLYRTHPMFRKSYKNINHISVITSIQ